MNDGRDVTILAVGTMLDTALEAAYQLIDRGINAGVRCINVVKPFDPSLMDIPSGLIVTIEDNVATGGFGETVQAHFVNERQNVLSFAIPDEFIAHGTVEELRAECGLTADAVVKGVTDYFERKA